jgi:hypothetical protein
MAGDKMTDELEAVSRGHALVAFRGSDISVPLGQPKKYASMIHGRLDTQQNTE